MGAARKPERRRWPPGSGIRRYGRAVLLTGAALAVSLLLSQQLAGLSMPLFFAAVFLSTWSGRLGPGLLAIALSTLALSFSLLSSFDAPERAVAVTLREVGLFVAVSVLITFLHEARVRTEHEATALYHLEREARNDLDVAHRRAAFLAEISAALVRSLDSRATLQQVADLAVSHAVQLCIVDVLGEDGTFERVAIAHRDPELGPIIERLWNYPPLPMTTAGGPQAAPAGPAATAEATDAATAGVALPDTATPGQGTDHAPFPMSSKFLSLKSLGRLGLRRTGFTRRSSAEFTLDPRHLNLVRLVTRRPPLTLPLQARGHMLGVLTLAFGDAGSRVTFTREETDLAREIATRVALALDNDRLYRQAQDAIRMRDVLLARAAHDLRTPLTSIIGYAQLLAMSLQGELWGEKDRDIAQRAVRRIEEAASQMTEQVEELLDIAHLHMGRSLSLTLRPVDLVALAQQVCSRYTADTGSSRIRLETPESEIVGTWDRMRLMRVLDNLINNAVKYSPRTSVIEVRLTRKSDAGGDIAVIEVEDHGIGIPAADLPYVFEHFRRASNVQERFPGSGLGLAGARQIVELHGGTIHIESQEGSGTLVTVELPIQPSTDGSSAQ